MIIFKRETCTAWGFLLFSGFLCHCLTVPSPFTAEEVVVLSFLDDSFHSISFCSKDEFFSVTIVILFLEGHVQLSLFS